MAQGRQLLERQQLQGVQFAKLAAVQTNGAHVFPLNALESGASSLQLHGKHAGGGQTQEQS